MMRHARVSLFLAGLGGAGAALAELPDPTRPADAPPPAAAGRGATAPASGGGHTVILRPGGKSAAVINGQYLVIGSMLGDKRVVKIRENEVVLKGEGGYEVVKATPAIEKTPTRKPADQQRRITGTAEK